MPLKFKTIGPVPPGDVIQAEYADDYGKVFFNGKALPLKPSLKLRNHSPTGFAWGYSGSGPSQLALAILLQRLPQDRALALYFRFREQFIAPLKRESFLIRVDIAKWASEQEQSSHVQD